MDLQCLTGMRVALVVPPLSSETLYGAWDLSKLDSVSPPLGLLSLAAVVRQHGGRPSIHDAYAWKWTVEETAGAILATNPHVVGVTCMTPSYPQARALVQELKRKAPQIPLIMGGPHITAVAEEVMADLPELDVGVLREGEITIVELLNAILNGSDLSAIEGILFRSRQHIVKTKDREFIRNLDILPLPAWDLLPSLSAPYRLSIIGTKGDRATSLLTTRGCPGSCTFCDVGGVGRRVRGFSADYVIRMIDQLMTNYGISDFLIYDDNFVSLRSRLKTICEEIIRRKWKILWSCSARVDMVRPDLLKLMKQAGCWQIEYGIESGSQKILDSMQKHITLRQIEQALRWTKDAGIETRGNFIFGFPGETLASLEETLQFALKIDLDYFQQTFLTPYPGSAIYDQIDRYGKFDRDLRKMNNITINFVPDGLTEEDLKNFSAKAFRRFYLRPKIVWFHLRKLKNISDIKRFIESFSTFMRTILRKGLATQKTISADGSDRYGDHDSGPSRESVENGVAAKRS